MTQPSSRPTCITILAAALACSFSNVTSQSQLCSPSGGIGGSGTAFFNLVGVTGPLGSDLVVDSIELTHQSGAGFVEAYYRVGGWNGYQTLPYEWMPLGVVPFNLQQETFTMPRLAIAPGETVGIALNFTGGATNRSFSGSWNGILAPLQANSGQTLIQNWVGFTSGITPAMCIDFTSGAQPTRTLQRNDDLNGMGFQQGLPQAVATGSLQSFVAPPTLSTGVFLHWSVNGVPREPLDPNLSFHIRADMTITAVYADPVEITVASTCDGVANAAPITCTPVDLNSVSQFPGSATLEYVLESDVTLEAQPYHDECAFVRWLVDGVPQTLGEESLTLSATAATTATAEYEAPDCLETNFGPALGLANNSLSTGHALGFDFALPGGGTTDTIDISSNGYLWLVAGSSASATQLGISSLATNPPRICALATSMDLSDAESDVHFNTFADKATVTWKDVRVVGQPGKFTVQCTLHPDGRVEFRHGGALPSATTVAGLVAGTAGSSPPIAVDVANQNAWTVQNESGWFWAPSASELIARVFSCAPIAGGFSGITLVDSCTSTSVVAYGNGCEAPVSFFQIDDGSGLTNQSYVLTPNNSGGYSVELSPISLFENNLGTGTNMGDDDLRTVSLPFLFDYPTSTIGTSSIDVCSNGYIWLVSDPGNGSPTSPNVGDFFADPARLSPLWVDLNPADPQSDDVYVRVLSDRVVVTWNECRRFLTNLELTAQCVLFDDGTVHLNYGSPTYAAVNVLTGFTPGNGTPSVANNALASNVPFGTGGGTGLPLTLASTDFPTLGTTMSFDVDNLPVAPSIGMGLLGIQQTNLPLDPLGAAGCLLLSSADILDGMLANTTSLSYSLQLPGQSSLSGASLFVQYAAFAPGINALGFVTSNGLELVLGDV